MLKRILFLSTIIFISCKKQKVELENCKTSQIKEITNEKADSTKKLNKEFNLDTLSLLSVKEKIPFGNKFLLEYDFPKNEWFYIGGFWGGHTPSKKEKNDSIKYSAKFNKLSNIDVLSIPITKEFLRSKKIEFFNIISKNIAEYDIIKTKKEPYQYSNTEAQYFLIELPKINNFHVFGVFLSVGKSRYFKRLSPLFFVLNENGNYVSALASNNGSLQNVFGFSKNVYIDENYIFHFKYFLSQETKAMYHRYEQYKISSTGKFIRYYEKNMEYNNEYEHGLVVNNTRDGKWTELKFEDGNENPKLYVESEYKNGVAINLWKYHLIKQEFNDDGEPVAYGNKKGKLLYTEVYENGEMIKREFVE